MESSNARNLTDTAGSPAERMPIAASTAQQTTSGKSPALRRPQSLRNQLFLSSALLTSLILIVAAWVINTQVVTEAREQVRAEVETLLPLYDSVWNEHARRLVTMGSTMASSPIIKTVFGDARAASNRETLREMLVDLRTETPAPGDLVLLTDGGGQIMLADQTDGSPPQLTELPAARQVAESQTPQQTFTLLGERLFQLVLTPVLLHSGNTEINNTLAVVGTGSELNRALADEIKRRIHSEVIFFVGQRVYASSLPANIEANAQQAIAASNINEVNSEQPLEITIGGNVYLAFARQLVNVNGERLGQVVVLRSLASVGQLFRALSNRLLVLWTLAIVTAWVLSYLIARRITRPLEVLATSARALGQGDDEAPVPNVAYGEAGQLARAFEQMRQSLKQTQAALLRNERLATIGQMASSIIHDLRNPLATMTTAAEVLKNDSLTAERRHTMLATQLRAAERMSGMLTEILEFSRGDYRLHRQVQPLSDIVQHVTQELGPQIARLKIQLTADLPAALHVDADAERLARVFENLLLNSLQALPEGGAIAMRARAHNGLAQVDFQDNGPGIPAAIRERVFEPFISQGKQGGTGLGLAIARGIVVAHGGTIRLENHDGAGAHFRIELPLVTTPL